MGLTLAWMLIIVILVYKINDLHSRLNSVEAKLDLVAESWGRWQPEVQKMKETQRS